MQILEKTRVDKWLWSVRVFKTRTLAIDACKSGKVKLFTGESLKPSYNISVNEIIQVKKNGFNLVFKVLKIIEKRVSASLAIECFEDLTPKEEMSKYKDWFVGKSMPEQREKGSGRPTKRDRREIDDFKTILIDDDDFDA